MPPKPNRSSPVTARALVQRINRRLAYKYEAVRQTRPGTRAERELGRFYIVDFNRNAVLDMHVDLESLARELGALKPWEALVEAE
jgi:hypothetical protein